MTAAMILIITAMTLISWAIYTHWRNSDERKWRQMKRDVNDGILARRVR